MQSAAPCVTPRRPARSLRIAVNAPARSPLDQLTLFLATGCGVGYLPAAPGTWGSVVGVLAFWGLSYAPWEARVVVAVALFLIGIPLCSRAARLLGTAEDPGTIVFDEIVGMLWTLVVVPFSWGTALVGLSLFRLFDTTKPWPIHRFERLHGGLGIMADDLAAALASGGMLWVALQVLSETGAG